MLEFKTGKQPLRNVHANHPIQTDLMGVEEFKRLNGLDLNSSLAYSSPLLFGIGFLLDEFHSGGVSVDLESSLSREDVSTDEEGQHFSGLADSHSKMSLLFNIEQQIYEAYAHANVVERRNLEILLGQVEHEQQKLVKTSIANGDPVWVLESSVYHTLDANGDIDGGEDVQELWRRIQEVIVVEGGEEFQFKTDHALYQMMRTVHGRQTLDRLLAAFEYSQYEERKGLKKLRRDPRKKGRSYKTDEGVEDSDSTVGFEGRIYIAPKFGEGFSWEAKKSKARVNLGHSPVADVRSEKLKPSFFYLAESLSSLADFYEMPRITRREIDHRRFLSDLQLGNDYKSAYGHLVMDSSLRGVPLLKRPRAGAILEEDLLGGPGFRLRSNAFIGGDLALSDKGRGRLSPKDQKLVDGVLKLKSDLLKVGDVRAGIFEVTDKEHTSLSHLIFQPHLDHLWRAFDFDTLLKSELGGEGNVISAVTQSAAIIYGSVLLIAHISSDIKEFLENKSQIDKRQAVSKVLLRVKEMGEIIQSTIKVAYSVYSLAQPASHVLDAIMPFFGLVLSTIEFVRRAYQLANAVKNYIAIYKRQKALMAELDDNPVYVTLMGERRSVPGARLGKMRRREGFNAFLQEKRLWMPPVMEEECFKKIRELDMTQELCVINRERIGKETVFVTTNLIRIAGNISMLTGVGAHVGLGLKLGAYAAEIGTIATNFGVKNFRRLVGSEMSPANLHKHRQDSVWAIYEKVLDFDGSLDQAKAIEVYVSSSGVSMNKIVNAPTFKEKTKTLYWSMNDRFWTS
ncbi:hypothetical protein [Aureibacter tunicatorum]